MTSFPRHISTLAFSGINVEQCRRYILGRQTPQGGFCFYRYGPWGVEEPNAQDTRAAVEGLNWLDEPVPHRDSVITWLLGRQTPEGGYASHMIADGVLSTLYCLDARPRHDPRGYLMGWAEQIQATDRVSVDGRAWLENAQRCVRLLTVYGIPTDPLLETVKTMLIEQCDGSGGYISGAPDITSTWNALSLCSILGQKSASKKMLEFIRQCENPEWGFTLTPLSSASSLSVQFAGVHALRQFDIPPKYPKAVPAFVVLCQSSGGGFSRAPAALPTLRATACALDILAALV